ncbi:MAG: hypothetical protein AVDCRST_MAG39-2296, partial [uncultured Sphingomonadaceae bacterium]
RGARGGTAGTAGLPLRDPDGGARAVERGGRVRSGGV